MELATRYGVDDLSLEHPNSPLGLVQIDARTCTGCETCVGGCPTGALSSERHDESIAVAFDAALCTRLREMPLPVSGAGSRSDNHRVTLALSWSTVAISGAAGPVRAVRRSRRDSPDAGTHCRATRRRLPAAVHGEDVPKLSGDILEKTRRKHRT
jgi:ferredoxin